MPAMKKLIVFLLLLAVGVLVGLWWLQSSLTVLLKNEQEQPVTDIVVTYKGGRFEKPRLNAGESVSFRPAASGGSGLHIRFTDPSGEKREKKLDVYFEPEYNGEIVVTFRPGGEVVLQDRMNLH